MSSLEQIWIRRSASRAQVIDDLAALMPRPGLGALLDDLNRRLRPVFAPRLLGRAVREAYGWEPDDNADEHWWAQGVTSSSDATALGQVPAGLAQRRLLVVTWYSKHEQNRGVRLSFLDLDTHRYRHVLLVRPTRTEDGDLGWEPIKIHAGGIVWSGSWLHVAATSKGCVSANLEDLLWVPEEGAAPGETFGHRWILPTRFDHRGGAAEGTGKLRWSFLSLEHEESDGEAGNLLVGEYGRGDASTRLARFPLGADGQPAGSEEDPRVTYASEVVDARLPGMQGVVSVDGRVHVSTSHGSVAPGSLLVRAAGEWQRTVLATPMGPEDLAYAAHERRIWTATEHPRRRWVVGMEPLAPA